MTATRQPARTAGPCRDDPTPRWLRRRPDAVTALTLYAALLLLLPARLVIGPKSAAVTPANLVALLLLAWWACSKLVTVGVARGFQPVRIATKVFAGSILLSFAAMSTRSVPGVERADAQRALVGVLAIVGVALCAVDGIGSRERLELLVRRLVLLGTVIAAIGWLEYLIGFDVRPVFNVLPLRNNIELRETTFNQGSHIRRVFSTTLHPIEFGSVMAMLLPLALHRVMTVVGPRWRTWVPAMLIGGAIPMSISRGAILGIVVALVVLWFGWPNPTRRTAFKALPLAIVGMYLAFPGLLGTIRSGFLYANEDDSLKGRTEDYANIGTFIRGRPWLGRGYGTFTPERYFFLDNQYLGALIELGFVGFTAMVAFLLVALFSARGSRLGIDDQQVRSLAKSLGASFVVALITFATFDALGFPMFAGVVFLLAGCSGAAWRLSHDERGGRARNVRAATT